MELRCHGTGPPDPEVYWTKGSVRMRNTPSGILKITNATQQDTGMYRCHAVNYLGRDMKTAKICLDTLVCRYVIGRLQLFLLSSCVGILPPSSYVSERDSFRGYPCKLHRPHRAWNSCLHALDPDAATMRTVFEQTDNSTKRHVSYTECNTVGQRHVHMLRR